MNALKLGGLVSIVLLSSASAFAAPSNKGPAPAPTKVKAAVAHYAPGEVDGAWLWRDTGGEHVRFTVKNGEAEHHFTGKICGKSFGAVNGVETEEGDVVGLGKDGKCAEFDFKTDANEDGFDVTFTGKTGPITTHGFQLDGKPMAHSLVHALKVAPAAAPAAPAPTENK